MSFSIEWNNVYKANEQMAIWPFSDLVSYVMRYARPSGQGFRVLELGCGAGANIPFFNSLSVQYFSVEGSLTVVRKIWERFPDLKDNIVVGDFTQKIPFSGYFDLVVDRSSLTNNSSAAIAGALRLVYEKLKSNGKFIGIDWFSTAHSNYKDGMAIEDKYTRQSFKQGQFKGLGRVHFSNKAHLKKIFSDFVIERLEHKIVTREIPDDNHVFAAWNLVARKSLH